jgi:hypothetical protein
MCLCDDFAQKKENIHFICIACDGAPPSSPNNSICLNVGWMLAEYCLDVGWLLAGCWLGVAWMLAGIVECFRWPPTGLKCGSTRPIALEGTFATRVSKGHFSWKP